MRPTHGLSSLNPQRSGREYVPLQATPPSGHTLRPSPRHPSGPPHMRTPRGRFGPASLAEAQNTASVSPYSGQAMQGLASAILPSGQAMHPTTFPLGTPPAVPTWKLYDPGVISPKSAHSIHKRRH